MRFSLLKTFHLSSLFCSNLLEVSSQAFNLCVLTESLRSLLFQFDMDGFFYSSSKTSVFSGQDVYIIVRKGINFLLQM